MRYLRPLWVLMTAPAGAGALAVLVAALAAPPARAQQYDPVEELSLALKWRVGLNDDKDALETRKKDLDRISARIKSTGDMRRALALTEWRDNDPFNPNVAAVDREARGKLAERFIKIVDDVVAGGDNTTKIAAARMIGEMGPSIRGLGATEQYGLGRSLTPQLLALLERGTPPVQEEAARALGRVNPDPKVVLPALTKALQSAEAPVREAAAEALGSMVVTVVQLRKKGRAQSGGAAIDFKKEKEQVVNLLAEVVPVAGLCLQDPDPVVRRNGLVAMVQVAGSYTDLILDPEDPSKLPAPGQPPESWSKFAKEAVARARADQAEEAKLFGPLQAALKARGEQLAAALQDPDLQVRVLARQALELIGSARQRTVARESSVPREPGTPPPTDVLGEALKPGLLVIAKRITDPSPAVRRATVDFLETLEDGAAPAVPYLVTALGDEDRFIRWAAARTLGKVGAVQTDLTVPALARLISNPQEDSDVREVAANTLRMYGLAAKDAAPALIAMIGAGESESREGAIRALISVGGGDPAAAVKALQFALRSNAPNVRKAAADALGNYGSAAEAAVPDLRMMLNDDDMAVRIAVSDALLSIGRPKQ